MRITLFICFMFSFTSIFSQNTQISPGVLWNDIDGEQINAHGGCVVYEKGTYYWFGEDRTGFKSNGVKFVINLKTYTTGNGWDCR